MRDTEPDAERAGDGERWCARRVPDDLRRRYFERGWWSPETLGGLVDRSRATR